MVPVPRQSRSLSRPRVAGLTAKTLQNHKSNAKSALLYLAREKGVPEHGAPLMEEWEALKAKIEGSLVRHRLSSFMRFCSANTIKPGEVNESVVERFIDYRSRCGKPAEFDLPARHGAGLECQRGGDRRLAGHQARRAAGQVDGRDRLERLPGRPASGRRQLSGRADQDPQKPQRPAGAAAQARHPSHPARRTPGCCPHGGQGRGAGRKSQLSRSAAGPEVAEHVLEAYCKKNGEKPKLYTIDLAGRFLSIARETKCLNDADCERLNEMREVLDEERPEGFTEKNATLIRQVLAPNVWDRVVNLPFRMMAEARRDRARAPVQSAVKAQIAVAIAILTIVPVRIKNLTEIRLGLNLSKPAGPGSDYWLNFPDYDVKNRMKLEYALDKYITPLIDEYIHDFRPTLLRGRNEDYLFPGMRSGAKGKVSFSGQITKRVLKLTGLRITAHQFRHAAGAIILQEQPGNYELVRQILGHRSLSTTIRCYIWLKNIQAHQIYQKIIRKRLDIKPENDK